MHKLSVYKSSLNEKYDIKNIEIDEKYFGCALEDMTGADITDAREALIDALERVVLYTSEGGMDDEKCEALFVNARLLNVEFVSMKKAPKSGWEFAKKVARACKIMLLFETYTGYDFEEYAALRDDNTGIIYNPYEYVKGGKGAYFAALYKNKFKNDVKILRINDGVIESGEAVLPEHGNGEVRECVSTLLSRIYSGYFSVCALDGKIDASLAEVKRIFREV